MKGVKKENLPYKICLTCYKPFSWREYMRSIYWLKIPEYATLSYFEHTDKLPNWFWTGKTKMNWLKNAIQQSLDFAYAHHIQRLMITGNFALLAGVHPDEVDA